MRARTEWVSSDAKAIIIRDIGHLDGVSVTNDAEAVVRHWAPHLKGRRLLYFDSTGRLDELLVKNDRFAGFKAVRIGADGDK
jgi:hypothetical protein